MKNNVMRSLIYEDEASLTIIDGTEIAREGMRLHKLTEGSAKVFSECLLFATFSGASLKENTGEISLTIKGDGEIGDICVSANYALKVRGSIDNPRAKTPVCFKTDGSLTVIRSDGYSRPFVGSCKALPAGMDENFEEYYRISEQLPTYFRTKTEFDEQGKIVFSGLIALQPLPFASSETLKKCADKTAAEEALSFAKDKGIEIAAERYGATKERSVLRFAEYKCNCSKKYLSEILSSVGKTELKKIVAEDGAVRVHCHYCNKDYEFFDEDVEAIFKE